MTMLSSYKPEVEPEAKDPNQGFEIERSEDEECLASFWHQITPGTTYYRCHLPAKILPGQCLKLNHQDLQWDAEKDQLYMPRQRGAAVWQFLGDPWRSRVAWGQQELGIRVLVEMDDNYTVDVPKLPGAPRAWTRTIEESMKPGKSGYSFEMHKGIVPTFDGVIVSTPYLGKVYSDYNENVFICRNLVDPEAWTNPEEKDPNVLRVVFSGSPSHHMDTPYLTKAFKWLSRQRGIEPYVQGFTPRGWTFAKIDDWTPTLQKYRDRLAAFDIGVAPLKPNRWSNGKSDLKALEYAMAGVMPLVAREEPFREFLQVFPELGVESDEMAWLDAVKSAVKDRDYVKEKAAEVKKWVLENRSLHIGAGAWKEAISGPE